MTATLHYMTATLRVKLYIWTGNFLGGQEHAPSF
jgi:hypothetical protein